MQKTLNLKVKFRESFRPFAPSVLEEHATDWFDLDVASPYMCFVADVQKRHHVMLSDQQEMLTGTDRLGVARSTVPAVTHVDHSARIQTVSKETNPRYHALISAFEKATGCPLLVNTSFNVRGEPIVHTPEEAYACFMATGLETLFIGNCIVSK